MIRRLFRLACVLALAGAAMLGTAGPEAGAPACRDATNFFSPPDDTLYLQGRYVFQRNCIPCHGEFGDGKGPMGVTVVPRPRNFTTGIFKYRTTPSGALPTDDDLLRTVTQGIPGTAMPFFSEILTERDRRAVVQYVKTFSRKWRAPENFTAPLKIPEPPDWFADSAQLATRAEQGRKIFTVACVACHGTNGDGKGEAAIALEDAWGRKIVPADLRRPWIHSGRELTDLYKVLVTGLNGTPMASFAETTTEQQRWELVAFIERLRHEMTAK
ncbi:MAG: c-type cytochrome [Verrucomicrobia bacterium]|nr:c-type cytochrome [Verrucomicrobiota bacterium]